MRISSNLVRSRHNIYYFRYPIPPALHPKGKRTHIKCSLKTYSQRKALQLSLQLSYISDYLIGKSRILGMRYEDMKAILHQHYQELLEADKEKIALNGPLSEAETKQIQTSISHAEDKNFFHDTILNHNDSIGHFIDLYSLPIEKDSPEYLKLSEGLRGAFIAYKQEVLSFNAEQTQFNFTNQRSFNTPSHAHINTQPVILSELIESYITEQLRAGVWRPRTETENRSNFRLLTMILGKEFDCRGLSKDQARAIKETLHQIPKRMSINKATKHLNLHDAIAVPNLPKIDIRTVMKYMASFNGLFKWAQSNGYIQENHFEGLGIKIGANKIKKQERRAFTLEEAYAVVSYLLNDDGAKKLKPHHRWGSLLPAYMALRREEAASLELIDIYEKEGIWCVDINDRGNDKFVKSPSSKRIVPIHPTLIEHGFLEYVEHQRKAGSARLFPQLNRTRNRGYGRFLGQWFNESLLRKQLNLQDKGLVMHSLRHTVATRLMQLDVDEKIVQAIMGHKKDNVLQEFYFKEGYTLRQLYDALARFKPEIQP